MTSFRVALGGFVVLPVAALLAACGEDPSAPSASAPTATVSVTRSASPSEDETLTGTRTPTPTPTQLDTPSPSPTLEPSPTSPTPQHGFPCDPAGGYPKPSASCPYGDPLTGHVTAFDESTITVKPFHTYFNDAEGEAYAKKHHLRYPFDDDYYDAPDGPPRSVQASPDTICTGIILVGFRDPMEDHKVPCAAFTKAINPAYGVPAALWFDGDHLVQLSELFRP